MGILTNKHIVVTGVLNSSSIAYKVAELALAEEGSVILTGFGRGLSITKRVAAKLDPSLEVVELDVSNPESVDAAKDKIALRWDRVDGIVHSVGYAPPSCLDHDMLTTPWPDVATAIQVSAYSLKELARAFAPLLNAAKSSSLVGLDFDATVAWPGYNWMGVAKATMESLSRYLARELAPMGTRVNLVSAGPILTIAAKQVGAFRGFQDSWGDRAPLGWDVNDATPVAKAVVALVSDWFPMTTGEIIHVDGGYHAMGA
ncbi:MAG: enoyl-ACP reductase FabI [Ferrimicrobium sp.]